MASDIATVGYLGRKARLVNAIADEVALAQPAEPAGVMFVDAFSGSATVTAAMIDRGYQVVSIDSEEYARVFASALAAPFDAAAEAALAAMAAAMAAAVPTPGLAQLGPVAVEYSAAGAARRNFWLVENAARIDRALDWLAGPAAPTAGPRRDFLIASLLASADAVANTTSVYGAFLKQLKSRARVPIELRPFHRRPIAPPDAWAIAGDAVALLAGDSIKRLALRDQIAAETPALELRRQTIVYADVPYNSRQYSANYAPLAFIAGHATVGRHAPAVRADTKTGLLTGAFISDFCSKRRAPAAFAALAAAAKSSGASHLIVSYSDDGILSIAQLQTILGGFGPVASSSWPIARYASGGGTDIAAGAAAAAAAGAAAEAEVEAEVAVQPLREWLLTVQLRPVGDITDALGKMAI